MFQWNKDKTGRDATMMTVGDDDDDDDERRRRRKTTTTKDDDDDDDARAKQRHPNLTNKSVQKFLKEAASHSSLLPTTTATYPKYAHST